MRHVWTPLAAIRLWKSRLSRKISGSLSCSICRLGIASGVVMVVFAIVPAGFYFGYLFRYIYLDVGKHG
ncbi:uncharacterized protein EV420DRAFT_1647165 [Desarmillaria tabescens]|uniref:Uncharacterized protein n=1 Tax=Armillaria tabescens TaxID=1929756 RepID=A0AA39MH40_ARMTA|nr:uncharacterized protein EV420DRAFT_1654210 [Desarmillaria tabescens]XP_060326598.1 uncharacterized protein EV420DRAFT_1647165 [Desarmillaria tabescens]KAK0434057.1 hypothetical protein EV420DRAFT_1654210 [Desarmillaria tabescens]KAK0448883.1 hypothetical protein EV420DRAFT_1647165 [Desarmillaria tabescens]